MRKCFTLFLAAIFLCIIGCAKKVPKYWQASGGSRSDATVIVGYTYNPQSEYPLTNEQQAHTEAVKRCEAWGYQEADPFGLVTKRCAEMTYTAFGPMCLEMLVTQQFQCIGRGDMPIPMENEAGTGKIIKP